MSAGYWYFHPLKIPESINPLVRKLYERMNYRHITIKAVAESSGISRHTIEGWRKTNPRVPDLEAALNAVGLTLKVDTL